MSLCATCLSFNVDLYVGAQGTHKTQAQSRVNASLTTCCFTFSPSNSKGQRFSVDQKNVLKKNLFFRESCFLTLKMQKMRSSLRESGDQPRARPRASTKCEEQPLKPPWPCASMVSWWLLCTSSTSLTPFLDSLLAWVTTTWRSDTLLPDANMVTGQW